MYLSLRRYNFFAQVINNGHMEVNNSLVSKYGCHVSQEDVCISWVAMYPIFPDSYSILRFPEEGLSKKFMVAGYY